MQAVREQAALVAALRVRKEDKDERFSIVKKLLLSKYIEAHSAWAKIAAVDPVGAGPPPTYPQPEDEGKLVQEKLSVPRMPKPAVSGGPREEVSEKTKQQLMLATEALAAGTDGKQLRSVLPDDEEAEAPAVPPPADDEPVDVIIARMAAV